MAKELIRNFGGKILGSLETNGTKTIARDFYGRILGTYDTHDNKTRDFYGRILSQGNTVVGLIYQNEKK